MSNSEVLFRRVAEGEISVADALEKLRASNSRQPTPAAKPIRSAQGPGVRAFALSYFTDKIARALSVDPRDVDPEAQLMDLGLESSNLLQMAEELETELKIALYPTVFFEHTTLAAVTDHFVAEHLTAFEQLMGRAGTQPVRAQAPQPAEDACESDHVAAAEGPTKPASAGSVSPTPCRDLKGFAQDYFIRKIARSLSVDTQDVDPEAQLMDLGLESSNLLQMAEELETELKITLYPTVFFEHTTLPAVAEYFASEHADALLRLMGGERPASATPQMPTSGSAVLAKEDNTQATPPRTAPTKRRPESKDDTAATLDHIRKMIAETLSVSVSDIDPDAELMDLGLESAALMSLSDKFEAASEKDFNPAIFFEHRTLRSLAAALIENGLVIGQTEPEVGNTHDGADAAVLADTALFTFEDRPFATPRSKEIAAPLWLVPQGFGAPENSNYKTLGSADCDLAFADFAKTPPQAVFFVVDVRAKLRDDLLSALSETISQLSDLVSNLGSRATTQLVVPVIGARGHGASLAMAVSAFLKTVCHEYSGLKVVQLDVLDDDVSAADLQGMTFRACGASSMTFAHYLIENSEWAVRTAVPARVSDSDYKLREGVVVLITGGGGALGQLFARHFAKAAKARVVLAGRRADVELPEDLCSDVARAGGELCYESCDIADQGSVQKVIERTITRYGRLDGIIHAAGVIDDAPIVRKTDESRLAVLRPKVLGAINLDGLTNAMPLDFFVCFSSVAGFTGNKGQSDYAAANGFLDGFMTMRNALRRKGLRSGHSISINWPLWGEGGMQPHPAVRELMEKHLGLTSMPSDSGLAAFDHVLHSGLPQVAVFSGRVEQISQWITATNPTETNTTARVAEKVTTEGVQTPTEPKTAKAPPQPVVVTEMQTLMADIEPAERTGRATASLAIVGADGIFPQSPDLATFWQNLIEEKDMISAQPDRWMFDRYHQAIDEQNRDAVVNIEAGYIDDVVSFDHAFFRISKAEADLMDPQQRLALQAAWRAVENAGYDPKSLSGQRIGVFVGSSTRDFQTRLAKLSSSGQHDLQLTAHAATGMASNNIPNRISYALDLTGPSELVDTACSSSLVALNRAADAIRLGQCDGALVLGVNAILEPMTFAAFDATGLLSHANRCMAFAKDAAGYVRSEGVGAIFVKPQEAAEADRDNILALVRSVKVNHGGRVQSLTAPNPRQQAAVIRDAIVEAKVVPSSISYVEAHGTGTALGDSVEVIGLKNGFKQAQELLTGTSDLPEGTTRLGSVKSNIGHLEAAAGMAGLIKLVLCLQHKILPKTIHCDTENPFLDLKGSPFVVNHETISWQRPKDRAGNDIPLRAGLSSFGFGGTNSHVILEEAPQRASQAETAITATLCVPVSAQSPARLKRQIETLVAVLKSAEGNGTVQMVFFDLVLTLQRGRTALPARVCFVADGPKQLIAQMSAYLEDQAAPGVAAGEPQSDSKLLRMFDKSAMEVLTRHYIETGDLAGLARLWAAGAPVDWQFLPLPDSARRTALPGTQFKKTPCWPVPFDTVKTAERAAEPAVSAEKHPAKFAPATDLSVEEFITGKVAEALGCPVEELDRDADLSELGFDSILAVRLLDDVKAAYDIPLFVAELRDKRSIAEVAQYVSGELGDTKRVVNAVPTADTADPIFVLSAPRSGSTLLRAMLAGHPDLFAPPELHLLNFKTMGQRAKALGKSGLGDGLIEALMHLRAVSAEVAEQEVADFVAADAPVAEVYNRLQSLCSPRILVDKSPSYGGDAVVMKRAAKLFPDARYIHLLRRPEAMMASFVNNRFHRLLGAKNADAWAVADKVWSMTNTTIRAHIKTCPESYAQTVHYEELVQRPAQVAARISDWLGLARNEEMTTPYAKGRMIEGLKSGSRSVGDPNFLDHKAIDPGEATEWLDQGPEMPRNLDALKLGPEFGYDVGPRFPLLNAVEKPVSWTLFMSFDVSGLEDVRISDLESAVERLVHLKPILATRFVKKPGQLTATRTGPPKIEVTATKGNAPKTRARALDQWAEAAAAEIGQLDRPVFAVHLQKHGAGATLALVLNHHVADGATGQIIVHHLLHLLQGKTPPPEMPAASYSAFVARAGKATPTIELPDPWALKARRQKALKELREQRHDIGALLPDTALRSTDLVDCLGAGLLRALIERGDSDQAGIMLRHHGRLMGETSAVGNFAFDLPIFSRNAAIDAVQFSALRRDTLGIAATSRKAYEGKSTGLSNVRLNFQAPQQLKVGRVEARLIDARELTGETIRTALGAPQLDLIVRQSSDGLELIQRSETGAFADNTITALSEAWIAATAECLKTTMEKGKNLE